VTIYIPKSSLPDFQHSTELSRFLHHLPTANCQLPTANCQLRNSEFNFLLQLPAISLPRLLNHLRLPPPETQSVSQSVRVRVRVTLRLGVYCQSVRLGAEPHETHGQNFFFSTEHLWSYSLYNILSDERMGLSFTIAAGPHQRIHYRVRVLSKSKLKSYCD
jgi:hypothetical protein